MQNNSSAQLNVRHFPIKDRWCLHSYYTLNPYAPDGSGRILVAAADLAAKSGEVLILSPEGKVEQAFGRHALTPSFWHTGFWQSWSSDGRFIYYQSGTETEPTVTRHELSSQTSITVAGDMEGIPPSGEPGFACDHGLLYAAGYGDPEGRYRPEKAIVPFQQRDRHGISVIDFTAATSQLKLSTAQILEMHPDRDRLLAEDRKIAQALGTGEGLTLMTYCVRWNPQGTRCLFYFGNHCVDKRRGEPRIASVFTADRNLQDIRLAIDLSFERRGVHWGWQPDGETLIGYSSQEKSPQQYCLAQVRYDGSNYRELAKHASGGHPSVSPANDDLIVTDEGTSQGGAVVFIARSSGQEIARVPLPKFIGKTEPAGRNAQRICHHPVFSPDGSRVLCNTLPGKNAALAEIRLPEAWY